ncbi:hypothetical protein RUND412_008771 [Rhizina undulata]
MQAVIDTMFSVLAILNFYFLWAMAFDVCTWYYALCGIGFWYLCHTQTKEASWFRVVLIPSSERWIRQQVRRHYGTEELFYFRRVLEVEMVAFEIEQRLAGPSPNPDLAPASREWQSSKCGSLGDTPMAKTPSSSWGRQILSGEHCGPPPMPGVSATESETKWENLMAERRVWARGLMESKDPEVRNEEWRFRGIRVSRQLANAQAGAASFYRSPSQAFIQRQQELQLAETVRREAEELQARQEAEKQLEQRDREWSLQMMGLEEAMGALSLGMADVGVSVEEAEAEVESMELDSAGAGEEADTGAEFMELDLVEAVGDVSAAVVVIEVDEATRGYEAYHSVEEDHMEMEEVERAPAGLGVLEEDSVAVWPEETAEERRRREEEDNAGWDGVVDEFLFAGVGEVWRGEEEDRGYEYGEGKEEWRGNTMGRKRRLQRREDAGLRKRGAWR